MSKTNDYLILGVMSGTSVDGLDLALVQFRHAQGSWAFELKAAQTMPYSKAWSDDLKTAIDFREPELKAFDLEYGMYLGKCINDFLADKPKPDFVASHGHTVLHQPEKGITLQVGNGDQINQTCGLPVVSDFRSLDVKLGGQGAPLVPIGDRDLFSEFDYCLNLGGIANVSFEEGGQRRAFDICPINMALNPLAQLLGHEYDHQGDFAREGQLDSELLDSLNQIPYCKAPYPKSLGLEDYLKHWQPLIASSTSSTPDKLNTLVEHVAIQIAAVVNHGKPGSQLLVTGGGAFNIYFMDRLQAQCRADVVIPKSDIVEFKEAIVFAYLGLLRKLDLPNCLASVTGASKDNSGGILTGF